MYGVNITLSLGNSEGYYTKTGPPKLFNALINFIYINNNFIDKLLTLGAKRCKIALSLLIDLLNFIIAHRKS